MHSDTTRLHVDDEELQAALEAANIPTLLLALSHLTGERRWLADPYRPTQGRATDDNDSGGLPPPRQREIRAAAFEFLREWRAGTVGLEPIPPVDEIVARLSVSLGEPVPSEYGRAMAEEAGFVDRDARWTSGSAGPGGKISVVIIGVGPGGICAAAKLRRLGIPFVVIERHDQVGGVWLENGYPGAGVDTPSHLYSFSWAPKPDWSRYFAKQPEILEYLQRCAHDAGILPHIRFKTEVTQATWDASTRTWRVAIRPRTVANGRGSTEEISADVLISAVGQLNRPAVPHIPGIDTFPGPVFHSSRWAHGVEISGRRVGVVGTGASAMQIVPAIAGDAAHVAVFQRSAQWAVPNGNYQRDVSAGTRLLMEQVPYYLQWYRLRLLWIYQDKLHPSLQIDPAWPHPQRAVNAVNDKHRAFLADYIKEQIAGDEAALLPKVLPDYPPYGKRILIDNGWYRTLQRDDVDLVTDHIHHVDDGAVVTADGSRHEVDVLVLATGFQSRRMLHPMEIVGRSGRSLRSIWGDDDAYAHLGMTIPDFPNLFLLYGPNTNLGHGGSVLFHTECQVGYITRLLTTMVEQSLAAVEVRPDVCAAYNRAVDEAHARMIWTQPGISTWYRNAAGRVVTNTPWRLIDYWAMTHEPELADFQVTPR